MNTSVLASFTKEDLNEPYIVFQIMNRLSTTECCSIVMELGTLSMEDISMYLNYPVNYPHVHNILKQYLIQVYPTTDRSPSPVYTVRVKGFPDFKVISFDATIQEILWYCQLTPLGSNQVSSSSHIVPNPNIHNGYLLMGGKAQPKDTRLHEYSIDTLIEFEFNADLVLLLQDHGVTGGCSCVIM